MPKSWIQTLSNIPPEHLTDLFNTTGHSTEKIVWPLSLLALRTLIQRLTISRTALPFSKGSQVSINFLKVKNSKENLSNFKIGFELLTTARVESIKSQ